MPIKTTRKMPSFEGVAAGQTATLRLPIGRTYEQLLITYSGATLAQLNALRVIANGEVIHRITELSKLDVMNQFKGRAAASGVIVFDFNRYNLRTKQAEEFTALGTGVLEDPNKITTLSLEIDVDAAAVGTALSCKAVQSNPAPVGKILKTREFTYSPGAAGDFEISDLPKGPEINMMFFGNETALTINTVTVERDNFIEFERSNAENELLQTDGVRTPQTDYVVFDPTENGNGGQWLETAGVQDLRFRLNLGAGGQLPVTVEYIDTPDI